MNKEDIKFQTYSWCYGTTSFRVSELKYKIEKQLILLKELKDKYKNKPWKELQVSYFDILVENALAKPSSNNKEKDARQKTSSLKDLGLIDENRDLSAVGLKLYKINKKREFETNNTLYLRADAYLYFKQFLKINFSKYSNSRSYKEFNINPFLSLVYAILELGYITKEEFIYRFPLCQNFEDVKKEVLVLKKGREFSLEAYLKDKIASKKNYQAALFYFLENEVNLDTLATVIFDRKSSKSITVYLNLYFKLLYFYENRARLFEVEKKKILTELKEILSKFKSSKLRPYLTKKLKLSNLEEFESLELFRGNFKEEFFYLIHTTKWHINLDEYFDLNKRFLSLSEVFIFENDKIYLDDIIRLFFKDNLEQFLKQEFTSQQEYQEALYNEQELEYNKELLLERIKEEFGIQSDNIKEAIKNIRTNQKIERFEKLIEKEFSDDVLITILEFLKERKNTQSDNEIKKMKEWDSDIPTIFEYIIGIIWYKFSKQKFNPSKFLNLSLDNNLYPIRFASGGGSDIIFEYANEHLMIEVTLSSDDNQRRMELEPVSRHLGKYLLSGKKAYAIFIAPYLYPNVLVAFRAYAKLRFYDPKDTTKYVENLDIIPLSIDDIICMIKAKIDYEQFLLYKKSWLESGEMDGFVWYNKIIKKDIAC